MEKHRILVIDDEESLSRLLKLNLESTGGYEVRVLREGRLAVATAKEFKPHLILLDVIMPDIDGGEVADSVLADPLLERTPIIFLTAVAMKKEVEARGGVIGRFPFIAKPATVPDILSAIQRVLGAPPTPLRPSGPSR